jgi:hypothetical protein
MQVESKFFQLRQRAGSLPPSPDLRIAPPPVSWHHRSLRSDTTSPLILAATLACSCPTAATLRSSPFVTVWCGTRPRRAFHNPASSRSLIDKILFRRKHLVASFGKTVFRMNLGRAPHLSLQRERLLCPGYGSLTLVFCLATRRCMNLGPSFLEASTPSYRNISQT